jgi:hypothetical protein
MHDDPFYHEGMREWQAETDSVRLADRLLDRTVTERLAENHGKFIAQSPFFFLATADAAGRPDCSYKGGQPGFVQVLAPDLLVFPDYDGNGMFRSLGNIRSNPWVGLLFIRFAPPARLRVNGRAEVVTDDPLLTELPGAQRLVRVRVGRVFPNCPRYIHTMALDSLSEYAPGENVTPPEPAWKAQAEFRDVLPGKPRERG